MRADILETNVLVYPFDETDPPAASGSTGGRVSGSMGLLGIGSAGDSRPRHRDRPLDRRPRLRAVPPARRPQQRRRARDDVRRVRLGQLGQRREAQLLEARHHRGADALHGQEGGAIVGREGLGWPCHEPTDPRPVVGSTVGWDAASPTATRTGTARTTAGTLTPSRASASATARRTPWTRPGP